MVLIERCVKFLLYTTVDVKWDEISEENAFGSLHLVKLALETEYAEVQAKDWALFQT